VAGSENTKGANVEVTVLLDVVELAELVVLLDVLEGAELLEVADDTTLPL